MLMGEGDYMLNVKWTGMNERGSESKMKSFEWTYILNDTKVFSLQVRSMICWSSIQHIAVSADNLNSDTNYSQWPFLRIILNLHQTTHISLIQKESYQQSSEKNESSINKVLRKWKIMAKTRGNINTLVSRLYWLML